VNEPSDIRGRVALAVEKEPMRSAGSPESGDRDTHCIFSRRPMVKHDRRLALFTLVACVWTVIAALVWPGPVPARAAEPIVIRAVSVVPVDSNTAIYFKRYVEEVNRRLKGHAEIRLLGGPEVVKPFDHFQSLRAGIMDMAFTAPGYYAGETSEGISTLLLDPSDFGRYLHGLRGTGAMDVLNEAYREKSGVRFIGTLLAGARIRFLTTYSITSLSDLKGKRIRGFSAQTAKVIQFFGASPQTISPTELHDALSRGVVDGAVRAPSDAVAYGDWDAYKYMIADPIQMSTAVVFVATRVWDKLPPDVQQTISAVAAEMEPEVLKFYAKDDEDAVAKMKLHVVNLNASDRQRLGEARASYWDDIVAQSPNYGARLRKLMEPYSK
jgi:TRAP-type C4-dicarboxylate transport system substrate-binding protein